MGSGGLHGCGASGALASGGGKPRCSRRASRGGSRGEGEGYAHRDVLQVGAEEKGADDGPSPRGEAHRIGGGRAEGGAPAALSVDTFEDVDENQDADRHAAEELERDRP